MSDTLRSFAVKTASRIGRGRLTGVLFDPLRSYPFVERLPALLVVLACRLSQRPSGPMQSRTRLSPTGSVISWFPEEVGPTRILHSNPHGAEDEIQSERLITVSRPRQPRDRREPHHFRERQ
jgi:hypothetical protein